ncbi:hypothetical protein BDZ91DRAFT_727816 [Kalaharituber pfeilii]|nr:hypothetical protein BDZ91DRAFT_727816 [Kalaharituber pfeilii]
MPPSRKARPRPRPPRTRQQTILPFFYSPSPPTASSPSKPSENTTTTIATTTLDCDLPKAFKALLKSPASPEDRKSDAIILSSNSSNTNCFPSDSDDLESSRWRRKKAKRKSGKNGIIGIAKAPRGMGAGFFGTAKMDKRRMRRCRMWKRKGAQVEKKGWRIWRTS